MFSLANLRNIHCPVEQIKSLVVTAQFKSHNVGKVGCNVHTFTVKSQLFQGFLSCFVQFFIFFHLCCLVCFSLFYQCIEIAVVSFYIIRCLFFFVLNIGISFCGQFILFVIQCHVSHFQHLFFLIFKPFVNSTCLTKGKLKVFDLHRIPHQHIGIYRIVGIRLGFLQQGCFQNFRQIFFHIVVEQHLKTIFNALHILRMVVQVIQVRIEHFVKVTGILVSIGHFQIIGVVQRRRISGFFVHF